MDNWTKKAISSLFGLLFYGVALHRMFFENDMRTATQFLVLGILCSIAFRVVGDSEE